MSTNTIILIVLGLIVLVILILGFTIGWDRFIPFLSTNNVDSVKTACGLACSTGNTFDFCSVQREVKDGTNDKFKDNCYGLATNSSYSGRDYGIQTCPSITCTPAA